MPNTVVAFLLSLIAGLSTESGRSSVSAKEIMTSF